MLDNVNNIARIITVKCYLWY